MSVRQQTRIAAPTLTAASPPQKQLVATPALAHDGGSAVRFSPSIGLRLQRKCGCGKQAGAEGECEECKKRKELQRRAIGQAPERVPAIVQDVLGSQGTPLDRHARESLEPRFGHDFSDVRIHADSRAGESAHAVNALAYTVGSDVVFAPGRYQPASAEGQRLLAHELTHVAQQRGASGSLSSLAIADAGSHAEGEADRMAASLSAPATKSPGRITPAAQALHKQGPGDDDGGSRFRTGAAPKFEMDPKIQAQFLAMCALGQGDPLLCAKMRAQTDPALSGVKLENPAAGFKITPDMMRAAQDKVNSPAGKEDSTPAAEPQSPAPAAKSPWSSNVLGGTIVEYKSPAVQFKVSIPEGVAAKFRAQLHDAQFIRISVGVGTSATFTASIKIDDIPLELSSSIDPVGNKASVSLRLFGATSKCATSVDPGVVAKIQDAGKKVEDAWKTFRQPPAAAPPKAAVKAPNPSQSAISKDIQSVKDTVSGVVDKVQPEIALGTAIAAFVSAVEAVEKAKKTPCTKASINFGATFETPLKGDPSDPQNKPKAIFGLSGTF